MGNNAQDKTLIGVLGIVIAAAGGGATWLYKRFHYGDDGLNGFGRDRDGFDKDGFDKDGYDFDGLDSNKLDKLGFDKDGYDIDGYSRFQRDREGRDRDGYYQNGFNDSGLDRMGRKKDYYLSQVKMIDEYLEEAKNQMKSPGGKFEYALHQIRIGLEKATRCIAEHYRGTPYSSESDNLLHTIDACATVLSPELIDNLHGARKTCNPLQHEHDDITCEYKAVDFARHVLEDTSVVIRQFSA